MYKRRQYTWSDGKSLRLFDHTLIMGILNGTPDSFSDGGLHNTCLLYTSDAADD